VLDAQGRLCVEDVKKGDFWYSPTELSHSLQGWRRDGAPFLLAFDNITVDARVPLLVRHDGGARDRVWPG
jgi:hypothetical protein